MSVLVAVAPAKLALASDSCAFEDGDPWLPLDSQRKLTRLGGIIPGVAGHADVHVALRAPHHRRPDALTPGLPRGLSGRIPWIEVIEAVSLLSRPCRSSCESCCPEEHLNAIAWADRELTGQLGARASRQARRAGRPSTRAGARRAAPPS